MNKDVFKLNLDKVKLRNQWFNGGGSTTVFKEIGEDGIELFINIHRFKLVSSGLCIFKVDYIRNFTRINRSRKLTVTEVEKLLKSMQKLKMIKIIDIPQVLNNSSLITVEIIDIDNFYILLDTKIYELIIHKKISIKAFMMYLDLIARRQCKYEVYKDMYMCGLDLIAHDLGYNVKTISKYLRELHENKLVYPRVGENNYGLNQYYITIATSLGVYKGYLEQEMYQKIHKKFNKHLERFKSIA